MIAAKIISSLEKTLPKTSLEDLVKLESISVLRGERLSFQMAYIETDQSVKLHRLWYTPRITGKLAEYASVRLVDFIPSAMPVYPGRSCDNYISKEPGLYPDLLSELQMEGRVPVTNFQVRCLWVTIEIPEDMQGGTYDVEVSLLSGENLAAKEKLSVTVIPASLPEQRMFVTQWFHCDCLADYYRVPAFSERHWEIIESFVLTAVRGGINTLLTPVFTPPLDTAVGRERMTIQLVGVSVNDGKYSFDYTLLDRWIDMCDRLGIKYFEISHLFTQWGAAHAPKIMAHVDREENERQIFGWDTDATGDDYVGFLHAFIPDFLSHMKSRGDDKRCIFHISDEPNRTNIDQYGKSRNAVAHLFDDYMSMDALSNIEFWQRGYVRTPCPGNNHIEPFLEAKVPGLWTYYCCSQGIGVSNRFIAMPGARTRAIGMQMYKHDIAGFLHWGYNFYYNQGSYDLVNPYADSTGGYFVPSGDTHSVYPSHDGHALESMRFVQFFEALQDRRAMELCEKYYPKERIIAEIESVAGEVKFSHCPSSSAVMLAVRERINALIAAVVK